MPQVYRPMQPQPVVQMATKRVRVKLIQGKATLPRFHTIKDKISHLKAKNMGKNQQKNCQITEDNGILQLLDFKKYVIPAAHGLEKRLKQPGIKRSSKASKKSALPT